MTDTHAASIKRLSDLGIEDTSVLSERGRQAHWKYEPRPYIDAIRSMVHNLWSPDNKDGNLILAVAENKLTCDVLNKRLAAIHADLPLDLFFYPPARGLQRMQEAMAAYANRTFMQGAHVSASDITVLAGCGSVLDLLFFVLADEGTCVGIPAPYYPAFDRDLKARDGIDALPLFLDAHRGLSEQLDEARAKHSGLRAILLTTPNNPTGEVLPAEVLHEYLTWCCANSIHLVSDEIYAKSIFKEGTGFVSMATVLAQAAPELQAAGKALVHVVFGLSKDWGMSGMRIGCLHTLNEAVSGAFDTLGYFAMPSTLMQEAATQLLTDEPFVDEYIAENMRRLGGSYDALTGALEDAGIPYTPAVGAIFLLVDLRKALAEPTWAAEEKLWQEFVSLGVLVTPGKDCHAPEPGYFRICYAAAPLEAVLIGVARMRSHIGSKLA